MEALFEPWTLASGSNAYALPCCSLWSQFPLPEEQSSNLLVTDASNVLYVVALLRKEEGNVLVGSIQQDRWMLPVLQLIVATPEEIKEFGVPDLCSIGIQKVFLDERIDYHRVERDLDRNLSVAKRTTVRLPMLDGVQDARELEIPDLLRCKDLDSLFSAMYAFNDACVDVVHQHPSSIVGFLLCVVRRVLDSSESQALVIVPEDRVSLVAGFAQALITHLGLRLVCCVTGGTDKVKRMHIRVTSPERGLDDEPGNRIPDRIIFMEADRLVVESDAEHVVSALRNLLGQKGVVLAIHSDTLNERFFELLVDDFGRKKIYFVQPTGPPPGMEASEHMCCHKLHELNKKVKFVSKRWHPFLRQVTICCSRAETVELVANRIREMVSVYTGVYFTHDLMEQSRVHEIETEVEDNGGILVTNVNSLTARIIYYLELPRTPEEFVRLAGGPFKYVYSFASGPQDEQLLKAVAEQNGITMSELGDDELASTLASN